MTQRKDTIGTFGEMKDEYIKIQDERIKSLKRVATAHETAIANYEKVVASQRETIECLQEEVKNQNTFIDHLRQRIGLLESEVVQ